MSFDLTLRQLRLKRNLEGSEFLRVYEALLRELHLSERDLRSVLRYAILFLRSTDNEVSRLGYRIVLQYAAVTSDYEPLRDIAIARDLMPVVEATQRISPELADDTTLSGLLFDAHKTNFVTEGTDRPVFRTRDQMELRSFNSRVSNGIVVAPTSYGKSEMLLDRVAASLGQRICILVPTKALIAQTRAGLVDDPRVRARLPRIFTHPDAYAGESEFVSVLTQERLQILFSRFPELSLDLLLVDEAHSLLDDSERAETLSRAVIISRARNREVSVIYYTPFLQDPAVLRHLTESEVALESKSVDEVVKVEQYVYARPGGSEEIYDQFLNRLVSVDRAVPTDEIDAVEHFAGRRTLLYVNRPKDAQFLCARVAERRTNVEVDEQIRRAVSAIAELVDPEYDLIRGIERGVMFHHGRLPEVIRSYVEHIFRTASPDIRLVLVCTSTLLEGVNTPADSLIFMSASRGRKSFSRSAFKNLVGRVGRFAEIFSPGRQNLDLLQPRIVLLHGSFMRSNWNPTRFLERVADAGRTEDEGVDNVLLASGPSGAERDSAIEYLENIEPGSTRVVDVRRARTDLGRYCFRYGVRDFDVFLNEEELSRRIDHIRDRTPSDDVNEIVPLIYDVFLRGIELFQGSDLHRLQEHEGARRFYSAFFGWRANNEPLRRMIGHFLAYWSRMTEELVYVGSAWGEVSASGYTPQFVHMASKDRRQRINLAVVKVKEESEFVDYNLMRYVDILNEFGILSRGLYLRVKYGTDDALTISLLQSGVSSELARRIAASYADYVEIGAMGEVVAIHRALAVAMEENGENDILTYEALSLANR